MGNKEASIVSLFLSLSTEDKKKVLAKLKEIVQESETQNNGKNISEEKL